MVTMLDCQLRGRRFKSPPGLLNLRSLASAIMSSLTAYSQWKDETATGHWPLYAETKKMKQPTLHTHDH